MSEKEWGRGVASTAFLSVPVESIIRSLKRTERQLPERERKEIKDWLESNGQTLLGAKDESVRDRLLHDLVRVCVQCGLQTLLASFDIPHPTYNYYLPFEENVDGPWDSLPQKWMAPTPPVWSLLGCKIGFPIGVPASVLTATSDWIEYYARNGFNVLTYKTVRSVDHPGNGSPNWVFLNDLNEAFPVGEMPEDAEGSLNSWPDPDNQHAFSMANSFGIPSLKPEVWQRDVDAAQTRLRSDQLLIVSVVGTDEKYRKQRNPNDTADLYQDFANVARLAEDAGARAIELNLSCPNTIDLDTKELIPPICDSPASTLEVVQAVRDNISSSTQLVAKLSYLPMGALEDVVTPLITKGLIQGISGINTWGMKISQPNGEQMFPGRSEAGVSGIAIYNHGIEFVRNLNTIRQRMLQENEGCSFDIIGMGGVMCANDVFEYLKAGADAVQAATAAFYNPRLAVDTHKQLGGSPEPERELHARELILTMLDDKPMSVTEIASGLTETLPPERLIREKTGALLARLEIDGHVVPLLEDGRPVYRLAGELPSE